MPPREPKDAYLRWRFKTRAPVSAAPALGDVDGDGHEEVIVASEDGYLYSLSPKGRILWELKADNRFTASPAIADLPGLGPTILAANWDHKLYAVNGKGEISWVYDTGVRLSNSAPALGDLDGDGSVDIVFGSSFDAQLRAVKSDGTPLWSTRLNDWFPEHTPVDLSATIASIDDVDVTHVLASGHDGALYCLRPNGERWWSLRPEGGLGPVCAVDEEHRCIVAGTQDGRLYGISPDGAVDWMIETHRPALFPVIGRSLDGRMLVATESSVIVNPSGETYLVWDITSETGEATGGGHRGLAEWSKIPRSGRNFGLEGGPALLRHKDDVRVAVCADKSLRVYSEVGTMEVEIEVGNSPTSPVVGDLDRDGRLTAVVGTKDRGVVAVRLPMGMAGREWPTYRDSIRRQGWRR